MALPRDKLLVDHALSLGEFDEALSFDLLTRRVFREDRWLNRMPQVVFKALIAKPTSRRPKSLSLTEGNRLRTCSRSRLPPLLTSLSPCEQLDDKLAKCNAVTVNTVRHELCIRERPRRELDDRRWILRSGAKKEVSLRQRLLSKGVRALCLKHPQATSPPLRTVNAISSAIYLMRSGGADVDARPIANDPLLEEVVAICV
jgi:hypothetical protein